MKKYFEIINKNLPLLGVLLFSFLLRILFINKFPPSLNWDEVSLGYNAFSLLNSGKDEWGIMLPLIFRAFGDFKLPLYTYLTIFPTFLFGLNAFSTRIVSAISGVGIVYVSYLIAYFFSNNKKISLFTAFITAISPWGLFISRVALEANLGTFLFSTGMLFYFFWIKERNTKNLFFSYFFWGLSLNSYNSARILVPIWVLLSLLEAYGKYRKKFIIPAVVLLLLSLPFVFQFINKTGSARLESVSLIDQGAINKIITLRNNYNYPQIIERLIFNRPIYFVYKSITNYILNLNPVYLFYKGGSHYQFSLPNQGLLFLITAPLFFIGLFLTLNKKNEEKYILYWFLIGIIPSAITRDAPHALRTLFILIPTTYFIAVGYFHTKEILHKFSIKEKPFEIIFICSLAASLISWGNNYINYYSRNYSWAWQYGYQEACRYVNDNYNNFDRIFFTKKSGEPHEFYFYYNQIKPSTVFSLEKKWDYHANWYWVNDFGKINYYNDWEDSLVKCSQEEKCLLIAGPRFNNYSDWKLIKRIRFLDYNIAFQVLISNNEN